MNNADKPINPVFIQTNNAGKKDLCTETAAYNGLHNETSLGLTKREYASMLAMQGFLSKLTYYTDIPIKSDTMKAIAKNSVAFADELLKQLETK